MQCAAIDGTIAKDFKSSHTGTASGEEGEMSREQNVKQLILDDAFFSDTKRVKKLLSPLTTGIRYSEGVSCGGTTRGECLCYIECIIIVFIL